MVWSSSDSPSRTEPAACRAMRRTASGAASIFSIRRISSRWVASRAVGISLKSKRWHRDRIVPGILCASVVANTNTTCGGGSSSVFSSAFHECADSMWTSSMM